MSNIPSSGNGNGGFDLSDHEVTPVAASESATTSVEEEIRRQMLAEQEAQRSRMTAAPAPSLPTMPSATALPPRPPSFLQRMQNKGGVAGSIATALIALFKFAAPVLAFIGKIKVLLLLLFKIKFLVTGLTMVASMWFRAKYYGWPLAVGAVMMIFIHECGHAYAAKRLGKPVGPMIFIPFMGAFVTTRGGSDVREDAYIGIMGPVVGSSAAVLSGMAYFITGNPFWLQLCQWALMINLFNLIPVAPLDGGWIVPLFSPRILAVGALALIPLAYLNPLIGFLGLLSLPRIIAGWKAKPNQDPYFNATNADRWRYGLAYLGLIALLTLGIWGLHEYQTVYHPLPRPVVA